MDVLWTDRKDKVKDIVPHATYSQGASSTKNAGLDGTSYMCSTMKTNISKLYIYFTMVKMVVGSREVIKNIARTGLTYNE